MLLLHGQTQAFLSWCPEAQSRRCQPAPASPPNGDLKAPALPTVSPHALCLSAPSWKDESGKSQLAREEEVCVPDGHTELFRTP